MILPAFPAFYRSHEQSLKGEAMQEEQDITQPAETPLQPETPVEVEGPAVSSAEPQTESSESQPSVDPFEEYEEKEYSDEEFASMMSLYDGTLRNIEEGEIVTGRVLSIDDNNVVVDIGFKSEGSISLSEFGNPPEVAVGDEVEVYLENVEDQEGQIVLSKQKADFMRVWDRIKESYDKQEIVEGQLVRRIKGGIVVDLFGVDAFLPGSQIDIKQVKNFDQFIGQAFSFKIIKLNKSRRNIVVSRRIVLEEERERMRKEIVKLLEVGQVREGSVKNITDFGAFIDLGGVDGLLHITDMSWGRVGHPSQILNIGDTINVKILNYDRERERISLGLKQLSPHPWENIEENFPVNSRVQGKVVSITDYGAFVELESGVEGLVHISEMSWTQHVRHPSKIVSVGDTIEVMVLKVDKEGQKISLGLKQVAPDPWLTLDDQYPPGTRLQGKVRNLTNFGAFVEIEEGIDGLIHISDMSWTKRIRHPSEVSKKGESVDVVVLSVDKKRRRISLGLKQTMENPWPILSQRYAPGTETRGRISRVLERGVVVDLEGDVEGFVPSSQLNIPNLKKPAEHFSEEETIPVKVVSFDEINKKIVLSVREYMRGKEEEELEAYLLSHEPRPVTVGDVVGDQVPEVSSESQTEESDESPEPPSTDAGVGEPIQESGEAPETSESQTEESDESPEPPSTDAGVGEPIQESGEAPETSESQTEESDESPELPSADAGVGEPIQESGEAPETSESQTEESDELPEPPSADAGVEEPIQSGETPEASESQTEQSDKPPEPPSTREPQGDPEA